MWPADDDDYVVEATLYRLEPHLARLGFRDLFDINCIVAENGRPYGLEITSRLGYDSEPSIFTCGLTVPTGSFLEEIASGKADYYPMKEGFTAGVRITIPPHPDDTAKVPSGLPVMGISEEDLAKSFYAYDLMKSDDRLVTAGSYGLIGVACSHADDIYEAVQNATDVAGKVKVSEAQYRLDLAEKFEREFNDLSFESRPKRKLFASR
jgi:phosphoribosylamine-glycine ligase